MELCVCRLYKGRGMSAPIAILRSSACQREIGN
jgi:hypothetical protein